MTRGYALNSQDIRNLIVEGRLVVPEGNFKGSQEINNCAALEKRVQPASFEPTLSGDGYVLDATGFKGTSKDSVYRHLLHLEKRKRRKIRLDDDHLLVGYSYLLKEFWHMDLPHQDTFWGSVEIIYRSSALHTPAAHHT